MTSVHPSFVNVRLSFVLKYEHLMLAGKGRNLFPYFLHKLEFHPAIFIVATGKTSNLTRYCYCITLRQSRMFV
jgi:hypothetical protein